MNAPKVLEGLPGIDWDSPDTYETADAPADSASENVEKCDDGVIQSIDTSVKNVHAVLKDKYLDSRGTDFSDESSKKTGYTSGWEIINPEETTPQRLHRIATELDELSEELKSGSENKNDSSLATTLEEVTKLRQRVGTLIGSQISTRAVFPPTDPKALANVQRTIATSSSDKSAQNAPIYRLFHHPDSDKQFQLAKAADLESRLGKLESVLGNVNTGSSFFSRKQDGIMNQLSQFETKLSLLDPQKLDMVDARLTSVLSRIQSVNTAATQSSQVDPSNQLDNTKVQKLLHLHELLSASTEKIENLPKVIDRLAALSELHNQAVQMVDAVEYVEKSQNQLEAQMSTCQQLLEGVSKSLEQTSADISAYCKRVEEAKHKK